MQIVPKLDKNKKIMFIDKSTQKIIEIGKKLVYTIVKMTLSFHAPKLVNYG